MTSEARKRRGKGQKAAVDTDKDVPHPTLANTPENTPEDTETTGSADPMKSTLQRNAENALSTDEQSAGPSATPVSDPPAAPVSGMHESQLSNMEAFFKQATERFEEMINKTVDNLIAKLQQLEEGFSASLNHEKQRIDVMQRKQDLMETKIKNMDTELCKLREEIKRHDIAANKNERFSRRNNIRLVGVAEPSANDREDCIVAAEEMLRRHFGITNKVERAHRDGRKQDGKPRHILIKLLSYRDKVQVMKNARDVLKNEQFFILDDLTLPDLKEKQKWSQQVKDLYRQGTKLRFYAGKWRLLGGAPFDFKE